MRGGLNGDRGRLLLGVGAGADELNNIMDAIQHDAVLRSARFLLKQCRADTLVPAPADRGEGEHAGMVAGGREGEGCGNATECPLSDSQECFPTRKNRAIAFLYLARTGGRAEPLGRHSCVLAVFARAKRAQVDG